MSTVCMNLTNSRIEMVVPTAAGGKTVARHRLNVRKYTAVHSLKSMYDSTFKIAQHRGSARALGLPVLSLARKDASKPTKRSEGIRSKFNESSRRSSRLCATDSALTATGGGQGGAKSGGGDSGGGGGSGGGGSGGLEGFPNAIIRLAAAMPFLKDRLLADPRFLSKLVAELGIDTACCAVAEKTKRGDKFWAEIDFFLTNLLIHIVLDVIIVSSLAPTVSSAAAVASGTGALSRLVAWRGSLPASAFVKAQPGVVYTVGQRVQCVGVRCGEWFVLGFGSGLIGQTMGNGLVMVKKALNPDFELPGGDTSPLLKTCCVVGLFSGFSSNIRYNAINGLERIIDTSFGHMPLVPFIGTFSIRLANNLFSGSQFLDWSRAFGLQPDH